MEPRRRRLRDQRRPAGAGVRPVPAPARRGRRRAADHLAAPQRALHREAGHPRHQRRRPRRRRRPGQGGPGPHPRRPRDGALRPRAAHQPRGLRPERAARPRRADPGGDVQRAGGARHPDPRLLAAAAAGPAAGGHGQPRGLHQPRPDHHPAEGPVRCRDPHPLPARGRRRGGPDQPGGRRRRRGARAPASRSSPGSPGGCAARPRWTSAPVSRPGSRSPRPRASPASALRRSARAADPEAVARTCDVPAVRADAAGQGRVRDGRGGPRARRAGPPAQGRHGRDVPGAAGRAGPVRVHRPVRRGRDRRDR